MLENALCVHQLTGRQTRGTLVPLENWKVTPLARSNEDGSCKLPTVMGDGSSIREGAVQLGLSAEMAARLDVLIRSILGGVPLTADDAVFLAQTIVQLTKSKHVTGRDLYARLGRDGPPTVLALEAPKEEPYSTPSPWCTSNHLAAKD